MLVEAVRLLIGPESACKGHKIDQRGFENTSRGRLSAFRGCVTANRSR